MAELEKIFIRNTADEYVKQLENIAINSIEIDGLPADTPASYLIRGLLERGAVGYIADAPEAVRGWYWVNPVEYMAPHSDEPTRADFVTSWGRSVGQYPLAPFSDAYPRGCIVRANPRMYPIIGDIIRTANMCASIDAAIIANVKASSTAPIIKGEEETVNAIKKALKEREVFSPHIIVSETVGEALTEAVNIGAPYIADKLNDLYGARWSAQLRRLGIASQSEYKRERVQTAEVNAGIGEVIDWVYTLIDTANEDCKRHGIPVAFRYNGFSAKYDTDGEEVNQNE